MNRPYLSRGRRVGVLAEIFVALSVPLVAAVVEIPRWWVARGVLDPNAARNDRAVALIGQVKWFATQAHAEFESTLFGGADLAGGWTPYATGSQYNFNLAQIGQIKNESHRFWDRLRGIDPTYTLNLIKEHDASWSHNYPWSDPTAQKQHAYKVATIQDLKMVFGFALRRDADGDGLVDYQELALTSTANDFTGADPDDDSDGDGFGNLTEAMAGTDATDNTDFPAPGAVAFEVFTPLE